MILGYTISRSYEKINPDQVGVLFKPRLVSNEIYVTNILLQRIVFVKSERKWASFLVKGSIVNDGTMSGTRFGLVLRTIHQ